MHTDAVDAVVLLHFIIIIWLLALAHTVRKSIILDFNCIERIVKRCRW